MNIKKTQDGNKVVLKVVGRLDTNTAPALQAELIPLLSEAGVNVELDFSQVGYISSAGLRVLLLGEKTAKSNNGAMKLLNVSASVKAILDVTGFSDILKIA